VLLAAATTAVGDYLPAAVADKIINLPGAEALNVNFNQFSGYLNIPGSTGTLSKHMHYWFVESQSHPEKDPIAFWTNGGPGCSGLIGFLTEQGPFRPNSDKTLSLNKYSWNTATNMVFIESPAGVGFSYSDVSADYTTGDAQTALDNYNLIQAFFARFPQYNKNALYISSESYGGHYMPTLAKQIVDSNASPTGSNIQLNFKGFAVGNPYTDVYSGTPAMIDTYWGHQLIAKPTYDSYVQLCKKSPKPNVQQCAKLEIEMMTQVGDLNPYALDYPICTTDSLAKKGRAQRTWFLNSLIASAGASTEQKRALGLSDTYQPCEDDYAEAYLNDIKVKTALHVRQATHWMSCSYTVKYNTTDSAGTSTAPIYQQLIDGGHKLNILVYSGDDDSVCGTIGTQSWIWGLGYEVAGRPWKTYTVDGQTAGYSTMWTGTNMGFLTIHGAGHEVPTYKPEVALDMWNRYLAGEFTSA